MKKNQKDLCKRVLSLLVCLMMCLSMLPGAAYAEDADEHDHDHSDHDAVMVLAASTDDGEEDDVILPDGEDAVNEDAGDEDAEDTAPAGPPQQNQQQGPPQQGGQQPGGQSGPPSQGGTRPPRPGGQTPPPQQGQEPEEPHEHTPGAPVQENETPATCGQDGSYDVVVYCSECNGEISRETVTVPATGEHTYDDGEWVFSYRSNVSTTYTFDVTGTFICSTCGDTYTVSTTASARTGISGANCEKNGTIKNCSVTYTDKDGSSVTKKVTGTVLAYGHQPSNTWTTSALYSGEHVKTCERLLPSGTKCTKVFEHEAHVYNEAYEGNIQADNWIPTCTETGSITLVCTVCNTFGSRKPTTIPALGHDWAYEYDVDGHSAVCQRDECGEVMEYTSHEFTKTIVTEPTCVDTGLAKYECECGYSYEETIPATGEHTWETIGTVANHAASTIDTTTRCSVCGEEVVESVKYVNYSTSDATCLDPAKNTYYDAYSNDPNRQVVFEEYVGEPDPLGHDVKMADCQWNCTWNPETGEYNISVIAICSRDSSHTHEFTQDDIDVFVMTNTAPTCDQPGEFYARARVYDAAFKTFSNQRNGSISSWPHYYPEALGHDLVAHEGKDATCTEPGSIAYWTCERCGKYFSDVNGENEISKEDTETAIEPLGHEYTYIKKDAYGHTARCTRCGTTITEDHILVGDWQPSSQEGKMYRTATCSLCGYRCAQTETYARKEVISPATCTKGEVAEYFDNDGNSYGIFTGTTLVPHQYEVVKWEWSNTTDGERWKDCTATFECTECGDTQTDTRTALGGHTPPTCTTVGYWYYTPWAYYPNALHVNVNQVHGTAADMLYVYEPALGHKLTKTEAVDATCTTDGNIEYWYCSQCKKYFSDEAAENVITLADTVISATGHAWGEWTIITEPTTDAVGEAQRVCANDPEHVETVELPMLPAPTVEDEIWALASFTAPTCTEEGAYVYTSQYGEVTVTIEATGHTAVTDAAVAPTCTETGLTEGSHCSVCGEVLTVQAGIPALGHTWDAGEMTLAPTSVTEGVWTYTCTVCGETLNGVIPALGGPNVPADPSEEPTAPTTPVSPAPGSTGGSTTGGNTAGGTVDIADDETPLAELTFEDVVPTDWFYEAVQYVYGKSLMNGVSDTSFDPQGDLNRAMVVTILYRLEGEPEAEASSFVDVEAGKWYTDAIGWASANRVVEGYDDEHFGPMDPVTREQLAAILYRYAQYKNYDVTELADLAAYADAASVHDYAVEAMQWAVKAGTPEPLTGTTLAPRENATRAQVAVALMNFCEKYLPTEPDAEPAPDAEDKTEAGAEDEAEAGTEDEAEAEADTETEGEAETESEGEDA